MRQSSKLTVSAATINSQASAPPVELIPPGNGSRQDSSTLDHPTEEPPAHATSATVEARPAQDPPSQLAVQEKAIGAGWQTNKKVLGFWSICSDQRNAYMYVDGIGWRKFADNSDSAIMAFNIIAAHAKVTGKGANYYEGDDGKVNTLYVW
jgi:hypothetical protein